MTDAQATDAGWDMADCQALCPVVACHYPAAKDINPAIAAAFAGLGAADFERRSHFLGGRFENLYIAQVRLPGLSDLLAFVTTCARALLEQPAFAPDPTRAPPLAPGARLRCGFWLNAMGPGQSTSRHSHDENDEMLSAVYYVTAPPDCGDLLFHDDPFEVRVHPAAGLLLFFPPDLPHSVEPNRGALRRLSIAFNIGPATD